MAETYNDAGLLLAWAVTEAAMRERLESFRVEPIGMTPMVLVGTLRTEGFLSMDECHFLKNCFQMRNKVSHGFREVVPAYTFHDLVRATRQLLLPEDEAQPLLTH